jgi:DNA replication protein DnaC
MSIMSVVLSMSFLWSLPFLLTTFFKSHLYHVKDKDKVKLISSKIRFSSIKNDDEKPAGIFLDWGYIGILIDNTDAIKKTHEIIILCSISKYHDLIKNEHECLNPSQTPITISLYNRKGTFFWIEYSMRSFDVTQYISKDNQKQIILNINDIYITKKFCTTFISGSPGSGKSMIGILIAKELNGSLVRTFNPNEPGDTISSLYNTVNPSKNNPLIVVMDEIDITINKIHNNNTVIHKHIPIQIYDKTTWNRFFDDINLGLYPYLIIILTSNISSKTLKHKYDPSYLRVGRIHLEQKL